MNKCFNITKCINFKNKSVRNRQKLPSILNYVTNMMILGLIPVTTLVFIICAAITAFVLNHTATGFQIYMIGSNKTAAKKCCNSDLCSCRDKP